MIDFVTASGRVGRLNYFAVSLSIGLSMAVLIALTITTDRYSGEQTMHPTLPILGMLAIYGSTVNTIRRLHDLGHNGWVSLLSLVPIIGAALGLYLLFAPGDRGLNLYGHPPGSDGPQAGPAHQQRIDAIAAHAGEIYKAKAAGYVNDDGTFNMDGLAEDSRPSDRRAVRLHPPTGGDHGPSLS